MFRSISVRLAALYTLLFSASVIGLGVVILMTTRATLTEQFDARIDAEIQALAREYRVEGFDGLLSAVKQRDSTAGALNYGLEGSDGRMFGGRLAGSGATAGWSNLALEEADGDTEHIRVQTATLPGGLRLLVGDDVERMEEIDGAIVRAFAWGLAGVLILGVTGGYLLSRDVHRRLTDISATAEAIIHGDLSRRIPVSRSDDDLGRMAGALNRMLDRIQSLMESLKQVSNDIAHDLRTPLTRLRQRLEAGLLEPNSHARGEAIKAGLGDLDAILETFAALLRIAQIEGGARKAGFAQVDLTEVARTVVEAFSPSAEDEGRQLVMLCDTPVQIEGDRELLVQMVVNLVENALRHTPGGTRIEVQVRKQGREARISVSDDGPGVPEASLNRIADRFYRLERSRSSPGDGLGLALVAAIAKLHDAKLTLRNAAPGLMADVCFSMPAGGPQGARAPGRTLRSPVVG